MQIIRQGDITKFDDAEVIEEYIIGKDYKTRSRMRMSKEENESAICSQEIQVLVKDLINKYKGVTMLEFEMIKELFKQSIDESDNMNEALQRLFDKVYNKGKEDAEKENVTKAK